MFARRFRAQILLLVFSSGFSPSQIVLPHGAMAGENPKNVRSGLARLCTVINPLGLKTSLGIL